MKRTPEQKLLNPKPGSKIAAAREFGIDLTLLVGSLRRTPSERVRDLQSVMRDLEKIEKAGRARRARKHGRT